MKIISAKLESELTELCARDLFIMIWYCSGQHLCYAGDHPAIPATPGSPRCGDQPAAGRGLRATGCALLLGRGLHWPDLARGCGAGWMRPDPSGCSLLVLLLYHQPLLSKGGDVAGGDGSCWELCVGLIPHEAQTHNGLGFFFFPFLFSF